MPSLTICNIQFTKWGHDTCTKKFCQEFVLIVRVDFEERLDITDWHFYFDNTCQFISCTVIKWSE